LGCFSLQILPQIRSGVEFAWTTLESQRFESPAAGIGHTLIELQLIRGRLAVILRELLLEKFALQCQHGTPSDQYLLTFGTIVLTTEVRQLQIDQVAVPTTPGRTLVNSVEHDLAIGDR